LYVQILRYIDQVFMNPFLVMLRAKLAILVILTVTIGFINTVRAHEPVLFSQFYSAPIYLNPAFAGSTKCSRIAMNYRQLRMSADNMFTINFSYDRYTEALQGGFGVMVTSDMTNMVMMRSSIGAMYAYHLNVTRDFDVHFGLQASYIRNDLRWNRFEFADPGEPPPDITWTHDLDFSAGILFFSDAIYGGVAVHHLNKPNMSLYSWDNNGNEGRDPGRLNRKYTGHLGIYIEPAQRRPVPGQSPGFFISPNIIYQHQGYSTHVSAGLYTGVSPVMAGVWYRHWLETPGHTNNNTLTFLLGVNMDEYRIGYSYDWSLSGFSDINHAIHELSIAFRFNCAERNINRRIINYPSF